MKTCKACNISKTVNEFYSNGKGGYLSRCKECEREHKRSTYKKVKKKLKACKTCSREFKGRANKIYCSRRCIPVKSNRRHKVICEGCGKEAMVTIKDAKFCSHKCHHKHGDFSNRGMRVKKGKRCITCDKEFKGFTTTRYCSDRCNPRNFNKTTVFFINCSECNELFVSYRYKKVCCSDECYDIRNERIYEQNNISYWLSQPKRECKKCKSLFQPEYKKDKTYCSAYCAKEYRRVMRRVGDSHRSRARHYGVYYEIVNPINVFERDEWKCKECGVHTPKELIGKNSNKDEEPTLDHVIPLSKGGNHTYSNTQLLCRLCNTNKSNKFEGQLELV